MWWTIVEIVQFKYKFLKTRSGATIYFIINIRLVNYFSPSSFFSPSHSDTFTLHKVSHGCHYIYSVSYCQQGSVKPSYVTWPFKIDVHPLQVRTSSSFGLLKDDEFLAASTKLTSVHVEFACAFHSGCSPGLCPMLPAIPPLPPALTQAFCYNIFVVSS